VFAKIYRLRTMRLAREICVAWHEWAAYQAEKRERLRCALAHFNEHACQVTFNLWRYRVFVDAKIQRHMLRLWFHRLHAACRAGAARSRIKTEKLCRELSDARARAAVLAQQFRSGAGAAASPLRARLWRAEMGEARLLDGHFVALTTPGADGDPGDPGDPSNSSGGDAARAAAAAAAAPPAPTEEDRRIAVEAKMEMLVAMQDTLARLEGRAARARAKLAALDASVAAAAAGKREKAAARRANKTRKGRGH